MDMLIPLFASLKTFLPAIFGALVAIWKREGNKNIKGLSTFEKVTLLIVCIVAFTISVFLGKWLGGAIAANFALKSKFALFLLEFFSGLSSLKIIDGVLVSVDSAMKVVIEKVPQVVLTFFDGVINKIKNFFR